MGGYDPDYANTRLISSLTRLEGSFGTEKQYYYLEKVKVRVRKNEILVLYQIQ
jgi:hypothetical protein